MRERLVGGLKKLQARHERFDDQAIGKAWMEIARQKPEEKITTGKGLELVVKRKLERNKVSYEAFVAGVSERVAWMYPMASAAGRVQISNANVYEVDGIDYRRKGIGTALYDLIERDVQEAGGDKIEPHFGSMSDEAIAFWSKRRPEYADELEMMNELGSPANGLFD